MNSVKKIVTHSGNFHADEVFACAVLILVFGEENISITRSREEDVIAAADIVVDVGGQYSPERFRFDHHQPEGAGIRDNGIPYASFGLVWKQYASELTNLSEVVERIDTRIVAPIDAGDNGYELVDLKADIAPYKISSLIGAFNASWSEDADVVNNKNFFKMVTLAKDILEREILMATDFVQAEHFTEEAYTQAQDKRIIIIDGVYPGEEVLQKYPEPLYVVRLRQDKRWGVKCVKKEKHTFQNRKNLPVRWAGLRDEEFQKVTGVPDALFCHKALFLAVAESKEGALALAQLALNSNADS